MTYHIGREAIVKKMLVVAERSAIGMFARTNDEVVEFCCRPIKCDLCDIEEPKLYKNENKPETG